MGGWGGGGRHVTLSFEAGYERSRQNGRGIEGRR